MGTEFTRGATKWNEPEVYNPRPGAIQRKAWLVSSEESQAFKAMKEAGESRETEAGQATSSTGDYPDLPEVPTPGIEYPSGPFDEMVKAMETSD